MTEPHQNHVAAAIAAGQVHPSISTAICKVKTTVEAVKKSQYNGHGKYNFAGADDIYAALAKKMGQVGLALLTGQRGEPKIERFKNAKGEEKPWAIITYSFIFTTSEGTYEHRDLQRTIMIQITGPQTFQAAQSFVEKSFLRSVFKLPTGEMDLDSLPQEALDEPGTIRKSAAECKRDGTTELFNDIRAEVADAPDGESLKAISVKYAGDIQRMPLKWENLIADDINDKHQTLTDMEAQNHV